MESKAARIKSGDNIKFAEPIKFQNGTTLQTFTVQKHDKKTRFLNSANPYVNFRIDGWREMEFEKIS